MISFLSSPLNTSLSRGIRNNNPGNLVLTGIGWEGKIPNAQNTDGTFEQFTSANYGIRAMAMDIMNDFGEGTDTLRKLINEYAPPHENDTAAYIAYVADALQINPDAPLTINADTLSILLHAQIQKENGVQMAALIPIGEIQASIMLMPQSILKQLGQFVRREGKSIALALVITAGGLYGGYRLFKWLAE